tara:strand:- start:2517 stop:3542 length:1026 start_codon:yes stop_codon:yes gene_type:complete
MSEFRTAVFNKKVNKIAVCFYGQYRTGTYCLPIIEKFLSQIDADVDVFCSLKNYTTYATRHSYTKNNGIDGHPSNWNDIELVDINYQTDQIEKYLKPKIFKLCTADDEEIIYRCPVDPTAMSGWADSIMLKQQYEADNDIQYDLVFMMRYDVLIFPLDFGKLLIEALHNTNLATPIPGIMQTTETNFILANTIDTKITWFNTNSIASYHEVLQDLFVIGSGNSMDIIAYQTMSQLPGETQHRGDYHSIDNVNFGHNIHHQLPVIARKNNIKFYELPVINQGNAYLENRDLVFNNLRFSDRTTVVYFPVRDVDLPPYDIDALTDAKLDQITRHCCNLWHNKQ